jgi:phenylacetate-coenzyme A ligase PaaK-like adenylate-forming protein
MLTKDEVRNFGKEMIVKSYKGKIYSDHTSGTTGKTLQIFRDKKTSSREWAAICYQWERVGYTPYDGRVEFRGFITSNDDYMFLPNQRILRINLIKLSSQNIRAVIKKINKTGYKFFHGYPSGIYKFTKILVENNLQIEPEAVLFASEILYDWQIEVVEKAFPRCKLIAHYGQTEKVALGAWTDERTYHFIPTYGIVERSNIQRSL